MPALPQSLEAITRIFARRAHRYRDGPTMNEIMPIAQESDDQRSDGSGVLVALVADLNVSKHPPTAAFFNRVPLRSVHLEATETVVANSAAKTSSLLPCTLSTPVFVCTIIATLY